MQDQNQDQNQKDDLPNVETPDIDSRRTDEPGQHSTVPAAEKETGNKTFKKAAKEPLSFGRKALRWLLGLLIIFFLGFLAAIYFFFIPLREETANLRQEILEQQSDVQNADQTVQDLESEINNLNALEAQNEELEGELEMAELHITVLSVQKDIAEARLALAEDDNEEARVALNNTSESLQRIAGQVEAPNQQEVIASMQERLDLVLEEIDSNSFAAESDLDVLATNLIQFENSLFARP